MLYLLDSSLLIRANNEFYPMHRFWQVWEWIETSAQNGQIKIPREIFSELLNYDDGLAKWAKIHEDIFIIDEEISHLSEIYNTGYGFTHEPTETQKETMGMDPFLINYCLNDIQNRIAVSNEVSKPSKRGENRKIPDVCSSLGIKYVHMSLLLQELDFIEK